MLAHTGHVMTLANSIIGVGILAMPFCFQKCGIVLAIFLLILSNWITRICCHYLVKSSLLTRRKSFEFLGFHAFGSSGKLFVELCIIGYLLGTCITYFIVVGDLGPQILTKMISYGSDIAHLHFYFLLAVTLLCILPLAMLKNVDSLSVVCTASIGFYVCLVIKIILESESHILANDWTDKVVYWQPAGILQCLPIFSMALSCQMQLFEVFKSVNNQSVEKLNGIVRDATWICTLVYIAVGFFGYVAFCTQTFAGNILLNFSPSFGSDVIKVGFVLSLAFSFPLVIFPCRASIYSLLYRKGHTDAAGGYIPEMRFKTITVFIVAFTLCVALMIPSVELIIGLVGSTIGVAICIMFPAACFRKVTKKYGNNDRPFELSGLILVSGFCLMVLGTYANLQAIDEKSSGAHLESDNLQNQIIKPTELPIIKQEMKILLNEKENLNLIESNKLVNLENPKLPKAEIEIEQKKTNKVEENLSDLNLHKNEKIDRILNAIAPQPLSSSAPILPVDEVHKIDGNPKKTAEDIIVEKKINNDKPILEFLKPIRDSNNGSQKNLNKKVESAKVPPSLKKPKADIVVPSANMITAQQTIDKDAIKKDEEIAAEESKVDELKKTQNELKRTNELLERKVNEMKEELVKQNKKTQDLVVEKLVEVVEKVEKIEREVQKKDAEADAAKPLESKKIDEKFSNDLLEKKFDDVAEKVKEIVHDVEMQKEKKTIENQIDETIINEEKKLTKEIKIPIEKPQVYEPLSYKTGEILEHVLNASKLEQNIPLPLPLLMNASRIINNAIAIPKNKVGQQEEVILKSKNEIQTLENQNNSNSNLKVNNIIDPNPSIDNFEAIRRDILELKSNKFSEKSLSETQKRFKRSYEENLMPELNQRETDGKLSKENCLIEPDLKNFLIHGSNGAFNIKVQNIGRNLKSLHEEKKERST